MEDDNGLIEINENINEGEGNLQDVVYSSDKDFYKGIGGELRFKAEGLFKKAREKGISIEEIDIKSIREKTAEFPSIGEVDLPAYIVKVKGRHIQSGQIIMDGKQIDYYNRYQSYVVQKVENKNIIRDERGRIVRDNGKPVVKNEPEFALSDWEKFQIGKSLVDDKEFGLEKTITGACDRVIRKLMGENDWLYPEEARLLDEEFNGIQERIASVQENRRNTSPAPARRATERQINYLKARIKNLGLDPDSEAVLQEVIIQNGFETPDINSLSTTDMSKIIDNINSVVPKVKEALERKKYTPLFTQGNFSDAGGNIKQ